MNTAETFIGYMPLYQAFQNGVSLRDRAISLQQAVCVAINGQVSILELANGQIDKGRSKFRDGFKFLRTIFRDYHYFRFGVPVRLGGSAKVHYHPGEIFRQFSSPFVRPNQEMGRELAMEYAGVMVKGAGRSYMDFDDLRRSAYVGLNEEKLRDILDRFCSLCDPYSAVSSVATKDLISGRTPQFYTLLLAT